MNKILNEEINRFKSLMGLNESESNLSEQPTDFTIRPKFWKNAKGFGSGGVRVRISKGKRVTLKHGAPSKFQEVSGEDYEVVTPKEEWDAFLSNDGKMKKLMNQSSLSDWETLKNDEDDKQYAVIALEQFNDTYPTEKWTSVVVGMTEGFEKKVIPGEKIVYPAVPIKFPNEIAPSSNFFKDNYYEVTPLFVETVKKDIIDPLIQQMSELTPAQGTPKAFLQDIDVVSSCSTLPNGPSPDGKTYTFDQLSKLRAQTAMNYVIAQLQKIGVVVNETTTKEMSYLGENGDGTSGPSWLKVPQAEKKARRPEFDKYKMIDIELSIILNTGKEPGGDKTPDTILQIPTDDYTIEFSKPGKGSISFRLPKIRLNWKRRIKKRMRKHKFRTLDCPLFDSKHG
jgi:hypothetical protein